LKSSAIDSPWWNFLVSAPVRLFVAGAWLFCGLNGCLIVEPLRSKSEAQLKNERFIDAAALAQRFVVGVRGVGCKELEALELLGRVQLQSGDLEDASLSYEEALALPSEDCRRLRGRVLLGLGLVKRGQTKLNEAEQFLKMAIESHAYRITEAGDVSQALSALALVALERGNLKDASRLIADAQEVIGRVEDQAALGSTLRISAMIHRRRGEKVAAEEDLRRSLSLVASSLGTDHTEYGRGLALAGLMAADYGDLDAAQGSLDRALDLLSLRLSPRSRELVQVRLNQALIVSYRGDWFRARDMYQAIVGDLRSRNGYYEFAIGAAVNNIARLSVLLGDYRAAEIAQRDALRVFVELYGVDHVSVATIYRNLEEILAKTGGATNEREALLLHAIEIRERVFGLDHPDVAEILRSLAYVRQAQDRLGEARQLLVRAQKIFEVSGGMDSREAILTRVALGNLLGRAGNWSSAEAVVRLELDRMRAQKIGGLPLVRVLFSLGSIGLRRRDFIGARRCYEEAVEVLSGVVYDGSFDLAYAKIRLGIIAWINGDELAARRHFRQSIYHEDLSLRGLLGSVSEARRLELLGGLSSGMEEIISFSLDSVGRSSESRRLAFQAIFARKGRALEVETQYWSGIADRLGEEKRPEVERLRELRSGLAAMAYANPEITGEIQAKADALEAEASNLERSLMVGEAVDGDEGIDRFESRVPSEMAFVDFVKYRRRSAERGVIDERYAAYVLVDSDVRAIDLGLAVEIDRGVALFRESLGRPIDLRVGPRARLLDRKVFAPLVPLLRGRSRILISPDSQLNLIPFGALQGARGEYRIEEYEFSYVDSARDLVRLRFEAPTSGAPIVIGDPDFNLDGSVISSAGSTPPDRAPADLGDADSRGAEGHSTRSLDFGGVKFQPLPDASNEAKEVAEMLGVSAVVGAEAREGLLRRAPNAPRILHIATHSFFLPDLPRSRPEREDRLAGELERPFSIYLENPLLRSGLAMAGANRRSGEIDDGILTGLEIATLNLRGTELLVLSACDTGLGEIKNADGVYGLRRAFALAGVRSQVMSLWKVNDSATRGLMTDYYRQLRRGVGRSAGLRQVQLEMLRNPALRSPYFWASFVLSGDWGALAFDANQGGPSGVPAARIH
jgi:CHAT domain-containing protein